MQVVSIIHTVKERILSFFYSGAKCFNCWNKSKNLDKIYDEKCVVAYCDKCHGIVKPDIVFFGEDLPQKFYRCLITVSFFSLSENKFHRMWLSSLAIAK